MKKLLKFLLTYKFRIQKLPQKKGGFTLIELLVGLILAFLVITPLLGFMINIMTSDRQEQAKSSSEQEIQTALDYIARDVAQAVFIYDGFGLEKMATQLPQTTDGAPVLVFWKREAIPGKKPDGTNALPNGDDSFVMSLVAYYLIKDSSCSPTWSCTARIGRVQLKEGVPDRTRTKDADGNLPSLSDYQPSDGFNKFGYVLPGADATGSAETTMNLWKRKSSDIDKYQPETLIDFVDQTPITSTPQPPITPCSTAPRTAPPPGSIPGLPANDDGSTSDYSYRQVPNYTGTSAVPSSLQTGSFYACVSADKTIAQVFIRGNALARIQPKNNPPTYSESKSAYFPKASVQVQGRGLIGKTGS